MNPMRTVRDVLPADQAAQVLAYKADIERQLPERVARVVLFGSRARGESHADSDYDVAVYIRDLGDRWATLATLSDAAYDYVLKGVHIRPIPFAASDLDGEPRSELAENIALDGVIVQ